MNEKPNSEEDEVMDGILNNLKQMKQHTKDLGN
jgi:hypothetical protein